MIYLLRFKQWLTLHFKDKLENFFFNTVNSRYLEVMGTEKKIRDLHVISKRSRGEGGNMDHFLIFNKKCTF